MKTSQTGIDLIKFFEGLHDGNLKEIGLQPKMDPVGIWTEGWGRAMLDSKGNFIKGPKNEALAYSRITIKTLEQANKALLHDLVPFELQVLRKLKKKITQQKFDALVVHTYNTGGSSTLFSMTNNNAPSAEIKAWWVSHYVTGRGNPKPLKGLVNRRNAEVKLYLS